MRSFWMTAYALLCLSLAACATGPVFEEAPAPPPGKALVYLMRPVVGSGSFWSTQFSIDGIETVSLTNNGYSWVYLDAGEHRFRSKQEHGDALHFNMPLEAGRTYYIESREGERIAWDTTQKLFQAIPADKARPVLAKMRYTSANPIPPLPR